VTTMGMPGGRKSWCFVRGSDFFMLTNSRIPFSLGSIVESWSESLPLVVLRLSP